MTFQDFLNTIGWKAGTFWGVLIFLMSIGIEIIPKIKWNPWSTLFKWIGSRFNAKIDSKMDTVRGELAVLDKKIDYIDRKVDQVQGNLDKHISESEEKALQDTRRDILDFCNACMNNRRHTKEQFEFVVKQCDDYEKHIEDHNRLHPDDKIKNGVIEAAIGEVRRLYTKCLRDHDFLKEGEES